MGKDKKEVVRVKLPEENQVFGVVRKLLGGCRMRVKCSDGKTRLCRIPGGLQREMWVKQGDLVIVEPMKLQEDERGEIMHRYTKTQAAWLKKEGYLEEFKEA